MTKRGNGEGTISQVGTRWVARITLPAGGKRKALYGKTRAEVARRLREALRARDDGLPIPSERQTVGQYLTAWLESVRPSLRPNTFRRYQQYCELHTIATLGKISLSRLSPQDLQALYAQRLEAGLSPTSVVHLHHVLHRALRQAALWGLVARNVADLVTPPRMARREMQVFTPEQTHAFLETARGSRLEALFVLAITTGLRRGELLALRWADVDLEGDTLQVTRSLSRTRDGLVFSEPKTASSRRQVALTQVAIAALRRHRVAQATERLALGTAWEDLDLVFCNTIGKPLEAEHVVRRYFQPLLAAAGLPRRRFHDLRHSAATFMLSAGVNPKVAAAQLGHSQVAITLNLYSHVSDQMQRQAAQAVDALLG